MRNNHIQPITNALNLRQIQYFYLTVLIFNGNISKNFIIRRMKT